MQYSLNNTNLASKRVLLRLDLDVPLVNGQVTDLSRLEASLPTLRHCINNSKQVVILGHLGRPEGYDAQFSLKPVIEVLKRLINQDISLCESLEGVGDVQKGATLLAVENLRFFTGESTCDPQFTSDLARLGDVFVNEAFAVGHRVAASTTGLPKLLPSFLGFQFEREVEAVSKALHDPKKPVIGILGGAKPDKLENVDNFLTHVDKLLLGGRLGEFAQPNPKLEIASLTSDGLDIDLQTSTRFARLISEAGTLIWNGPMGKYEDVNHIKGTQVIAEAIAASSAYKIAGGGDTIAVINKLELKEKFDHISIGGGAMMYLLANGSLPSLEAIHTQNMDKDL